MSVSRQHGGQATAHIHGLIYCTNSNESSSLADVRAFKKLFNDNILRVFDIDAACGMHCACLRAQ
ncbi:hypothetical protein BN2497_12283 [Janthinobacterium sp. CG23_2]|nr:hypothetical protein BN2497_12283 [Janthinobacterium sp. CG23_2]CUU32539.1 hypothetical protein BN3177_12283 [Janthinobacterium sp. CG23_2]